MEKDYNAKLKYSKETVDEQIKEACRGILKEKDDEINKLGIKVGQHMSLPFHSIAPFAAEKGHG